MSMLRLTGSDDEQVVVRASRVISVQRDCGTDTIIEYTASAMAPDAYSVFVKETPFEIADMIDKIENKGWNE